MDDVEIVVSRRKGVQESKALKLLSKFLTRDQEKDIDDQVRLKVPTAVKTPPRRTTHQP
jgi:hypothetical protein